MKTTLRLLFISSTCLGTIAKAAVLYYGAHFYEDWKQTSNSASALPTSVAPLTFLFAQVAADISAARWKSPVTSFSNFYLVGLPAIYNGSNGSFASIASMQGQFPSGAWPFQITAGSSAGNATLTVPTYDFPSEVPFLINNTYSGLQLCPAGIPASIQLKTWSSANPLTTTRTTSYTIYDLTNSTHFEYSTQGSNSWGGSPIPASHVLSGHYYSLSLDNIVEKAVSNAGFGSATSIVQFHKRNYVEYQVAANTGTVAGKVTLQNTNYFPNEPISADILDSSDNSIEHKVFNIDVYGHYAFTTTKSGVHNIRFQGRHWLSKRALSVNLNVGQNAVNISLTNGDVDGDNAVSIFDFIILSDYFDATSSDTNWATVGTNGWRPVDADLDFDGSVNIFDYIYLSDAFDFSGD